MSSEQSSLTINMISAACCFPGLQGLDEKAQQIMKHASEESGIPITITVIPATTAMMTHKPLIAELMARANRGEIPVPALLVGNTVVSYGVPSPEEMKAILEKHTS